MPSSGGDVREYVAVHGCLRALTAAVVAVTVAVRDTGRPSASYTRGVGPWAGSQCRRVSDLGPQRACTACRLRREPLVSDRVVNQKYPLRVK